MPSRVIDTMTVSKGLLTALTTSQLTAGSNVTLTQGAGTLTIAAAAGPAVPVTDTDTIALTLAGSALSAAVRAQMSLTSDAGGLRLQNDASAPGNGRYYGTDKAGTKGYFALPVSTSEGYWRYDTSTTMASPGSGKLRFN